MAPPRITPARISAALALAATIAAPLTITSEGRPDAAYYDVGHVLTGGYGHTGGDVPEVGSVITKAQADAWLAADLSKHGAGIARCLNEEIVVSAPPHVLASIEDFGFNVGVSNFCGSTMRKKMNAGDYVGVCSEFQKWVYVKGKDCRIKSSNCRGIPIRREKERRLCLGETP